MGSNRKCRITNPIPLHLIPWLPSNHTLGKQKDHTTIGPSLHCFHLTCKKLNLTSSPGPLTPLKHNPDFAPGLSSQFLKEVWPHDQIGAEHFCQRGSLLSYESLTPKTHNSYFPFQTYVQLRHFFKIPKYIPWLVQRTNDLFQNQSTEPSNILHVRSPIFQFWGVDLV